MKPPGPKGKLRAMVVLGCGLVVVGAAVWVYVMGPRFGWFIAPEMTTEHVSTVPPEGATAVLERMEGQAEAEGYRVHYLRDSYYSSRLVTVRGRDARVKRLAEWHWECRFEVRVPGDGRAMALCYKLLDGRGRLLASSRAREYYPGGDQVMRVVGSGTMPAALIRSVRKSEWAFLVNRYGEEVELQG